MTNKPPQEATKPTHSHFTPDALKLRVCPVCGVCLPTPRSRPAELDVKCGVILPTSKEERAV